MHTWALVIPKEGFVYNPGSSTEGVGASRVALEGNRDIKA